MSERRACIVCDGERPFDSFYSRDGFTMVRCPRCRLVFQDPQPSREVLDETYYHDEEWTRQIVGELRKRIVERARHNLGLLSSAGVPPGGRALDVGSSSGAFMELARDAGWDPVGVEIGQSTAAAARGRGLDVRTGTLADVTPGLERGSYSLVTFFDVLEHLHDPRRELALALDLLRPGGVLAATMPNVEGWYPRATRRLIAAPTGHWEYPELPVHLYDFSPPTARRLLERTGYSDVRGRTYETPFWYYRWTSLSPAALGSGRKGRALRAAFELLRIPIYPLARLADRANAQFVTARRP